ncbi:ComEC/Rec2 family competence protein [Thermaurantiacus sp.]
MATLVERLSQKSWGAPSAIATRPWSVLPFIEAERAQWPLFIPVALGAGVAAWFLLPLVGQRQAALLFGLALALAGLVASGLIRRLLVGAGLLFATGLVVAELRSLSVAAPVLHHRLAAGEVAGVIEEMTPRRGGAAVELRLRRADGIRLAVTLPIPVPPFLAPGAEIAVEAAFEPRRGPTLPGGFDPARRAWFEGVSASGRATGPPRLIAPAPLGTGHLLTKTRTRIDRFLAESLGKEQGAIAAALVTGRQGAIPEELRRAMQIAGLAHLLTVSGFHIGVVAGAAFLFARRLLALTPAARSRSLRLPTAAFAITAAWVYVAISGAEVPAIRAGVTVSLVLFALSLGRDPFSLRLIAFAATVILLLRPESLVSASFQLSFAAVTALVLFTNSAFFRRWLAPAADAGLLRAAKWVGAMLLSSLVAELVLTPIAAAHFGRAGVYGVAANMLAIPLTSLLVMPLLALHLLLGTLGLAALSAPLVGGSIGILAQIATEVAALPGSSVEVARIGSLPFGLAVAGALLAFLLAGPLRWLGVPLLVAAPLIHFAQPKPNLFVSHDARQIGLLASDQTLHLGRGTGKSFTARTWAEAAAAPAVRPLSAWPGARCGDFGCLVEARPGVMLLFVVTDEAADPALFSWCSRADLVIGHRLPPGCQPRWRAIDRDSLVRSGALAIHLEGRRIHAQADVAGDHPWSPAALPGVQKTLLGTVRWTEPLAE